MSLILYAYLFNLPPLTHSSILSPHPLPFTPLFFPSIYVRLVGEVHATLYVILKHCLSFDPFIEEIMDHIRNKKEAPHGRVCMMEFIAVACFEVCVWLLVLFAWVYEYLCIFVLLFLVLCVSYCRSEDINT